MRIVAVKNDEKIDLKDSVQKDHIAYADIVFSINPSGTVNILKNRYGKKFDNVDRDAFFNMIEMNLNK
jgi:hypothetical protein